MTFRARVAVCTPDDRVPFYVSSHQAVEAVQRGQAVRESDKMIRLTAAVVSVAVRPGSFGVTRTHHQIGRDYGLSGGVVFAHHTNLHDGARRAA